jgi:predicted nucleotidyltransferase
MAPFTRLPAKIAQDAARRAAALLARDPRVRLVYLFGSATRDDFDPQRSDLDFLVDFEALPPGGHADAYFGLLEDLKALFDRPIDLVESSTLRNPYRRQEIETTQVLLHAAA